MSKAVILARNAFKIDQTCISLHGRKNSLLQQGEGGPVQAGVVIAVVTEAIRSAAATFQWNHVLGLNTAATAAATVQPGFAR